MNKSNPHILFISYDGMTDPLGQSQVIPYLQGLVAKGYNISILSCEKKLVYAAHRNRIQQILADSGINWHPIFYTKKPAVLSTLYDIFQLKRTAGKIYKNFPYTLVHTRPGIPALVGLGLKNKYKVSFLNDIREFYADSRVDGGMWNQSSFLYRFIYRYFKQQEQLQVENSDGIVCLTNSAEKIIQQWPTFKQSTPLTVIPCSADLQLFDPSTISENSQQQLRDRYGIKENDIVISYLGSIGGWYLTDEMLRFCKMLSEKISTVKFLFISPHRHELIVDAASKYQIAPQSIITVKAERKEVPLLVSLSNYSLFFIKPCYSKLSSSPTKHGELMAMGIPVITNSGVGDMKEIVLDNAAGFVVDDFRDESFTEVITKIVDRVTFDNKQIRHAAEKTYSLEIAIEQYAKMYQTILSK